MAISLSAKAEILISKRTLEPNLILEIDGIDTIYSAIQVLQLSYFDDPGLVFDAPGIIFDGSKKNENAKNYISLGASGNNLTQQLLQDKGGSSSVTNFTVNLVDFNNEITQLITPGIMLEDIIGTKCRIFINYAGGVHPKDSVLVHRGIVSNVESKSGSVNLTIDAPERQKHQEIFVKETTYVASNEDKIFATINVLHFDQTSPTGTNDKAVVFDDLNVEKTYGLRVGDKITITGAVNGTNNLTGIAITGFGKNKYNSWIETATTIVSEIDSPAVATFVSTSINEIHTDINVADANQFILPADAGTLRSFIRIDDEIIEWTGKTATSFTGCVRGALGTTAAVHAIDAEVNSSYLISGNGMELALKLMLSGGPAVFAEEPAIQFYKISPTENRFGSVFFKHYNIQEKLGLVAGDTLSVTGSSGGLNDLVDAVIVRFGVNDYGSWIETDQSTVLETASTAVVTFKSKYNVLGAGAGATMTPTDVDVERHEEMIERYNASIPDYEFFIDDSINPSQFIPEQIYWPASFYSLPRKAKASVGITVPPIADQKVVTLDETNVIKPSGLSSKRSTNKYFYNSVIYKYNKNIQDGKYKSGKVFYSSDSQNRIKNQGNKPLVVSSDGMKDIPATENIVRTNSRRLLERYQFASESYQGVKVLGKAGVTLEVGDITIFGSPEFKLSNIDTGNRVMTPKLYEVVNKSLNVKTQEVVVDLLSTNFELDGRYGIIAPSSKIGSGSTTTKVMITDSFSTVSPAIERDKWPNYIGEQICIHSKDWSYNETTTLVGFDSSNDYAMIVSPALPSAPLAGYIVDMPPYNDSSAEVNSKWKMMHCCFNPTITVLSGISTTQFTVAPLDEVKFVIGQKIRIHNADYSIDSDEAIVVDALGGIVTIQEPISFIPAAGQLVELVGYTDLGAPYRWI